MLFSFLHLFKFLMINPLLQCWQVGTCERRVVPVSDTLQLSTTYLSMRLKANSFKTGVLLIKCTAVIKDFYEEKAELAVKENKLAETIMLGSLGKRKHGSITYFCAFNLINLLLYWFRFKSYSINRVSLLNLNISNTILKYK